MCQSCKFKKYQQVTRSFTSIYEVNSQQRALLTGSTRFLQSLFPKILVTWSRNMTPLNSSHSDQECWNFIRKSASLSLSSPSSAWERARGCEQGNALRLLPLDAHAYYCFTKLFCLCWSLPVSAYIQIKCWLLRNIEAFRGRSVCPRMVKGAQSEKKSFITKLDVHDE